MTEGATHRGAASRATIWFAAVSCAVLLGAVLGLSVAMVRSGMQVPPQLRQDLPAALPAELPRIVTPERTPADAPVVVIDPGHGGFDPGASGSGVVEKEAVLSLSLALRDRLLRLGGVRVALTREDDRFLPLVERVALAEALGASAFISIHADSVDDASVEGANVYVLSTRASDAEAYALALANNRDFAAGEDDAAVENEVNAILGELARREAAIGSYRLANAMERVAQGALPIHAPFRRKARFVVLRSDHMASVLFEAGYLSNPADAKRLSGERGRAVVADSLAKAIVAHALSSG